MFRNSSFFIILLGVYLGISSCNTAYRTQGYQPRSYRITDSLGQDPSMEKLLAPYREEVWRRMNDTIGFAAITLDHKRPEGTLGNYFADALLYMAREKYPDKVDAAVINHGGLRLNQIPVGPVTRGKIFEVMPFDNLLILQKLSGKTLQEFVDLTAANGGWPLAGITMQIKDKKAVNVKVNGMPLDPAATYTLANSDFLANGGDNANMLRNVPQIQNGYLMRDAFIDYIIKMRAAGKPISTIIENRVSYAE